MVFEAPLTAEDINWKLNCEGVLAHIWRHQKGREIHPHEYARVREELLKCLKSYFLDNEESFDVWPGIQNLLKTIEKKKSWDYIIVSDFWEEDTRFMLDSCGMFSRKVNIITADDGHAPGKLVKRYLKKRDLTRDDRIYLVTRNLRRKDVSKNRDRWKLTRKRPPEKKKSGMVNYPRFAKFF